MSLASQWAVATAIGFTLVGFLPCRSELGFWTFGLLGSIPQGLLLASRGGWGALWVVITAAAVPLAASFSQSRSQWVRGCRFWPDGRWPAPSVAPRPARSSCSDLLTELPGIATSLNCALLGFAAGAVYGGITGVAMAKILPGASAPSS